jgi:hypothetical protein
MARSANEKPLLYRSHSESDLDSDSYESDIDSMEQIMKALKSRSEGILQAQTESLLQTTKNVKKDSTFEDESKQFDHDRHYTENHEGTLVAAMVERQVDAGYLNRKGSSKNHHVPVPFRSYETKKLPVKSTTPPAGFLIQPNASPLRRLPRTTLPFAPIDCRINA